MVKGLSILIPSRNEMFLSRTIEDILTNIRGDTEVIVGLDGAWAEPRIKDDPRVKIFHVSESIGQRAITNQLARLSKAKYIMKTDAHCAFDEGFDVKMMNEMHDDWTLIPTMRNLHIFDWVCSNGHRRYQGPSGLCTECGQPTKIDIVWIAKTNPQSNAYRFDRSMHFQYWNEFAKRQQGDITESLSIQGSCFMITRKKYWELDICSERFNSWGQQGVEVACKTWLSGGKVMVNHKTWYAHLFRTQGGDFGFPYENPQSRVNENRELTKKLFEHDGWDKAVHPFSWLLKKFNPPDWNVTKGILYYTNNRLNMKLAKIVRKQIEKSGLPITSVTLKPTKFGKNIHFKGENGYVTMFKQILTGLRAMKEDIVYFCEHDVLYHPDHFVFTPKENKFYYNGNYWMLRPDGFAIHYNVSPLSGLVVKRDIAIKHFEERVEMIEKLGKDYRPLQMGFEPFTHKRIPWKNWYDYELFMPENPNVDITYEGNSTWKRWKIEDFRRKPTFWEESTIDKIPGWDNLKELL